jgi:GPI ethanolamine phosphate transferase 1
MNSVGILPLPFLKNTDAYKAQALYANALSILAQYEIKFESKKRTELFFQDFAPLKNMTFLVQKINIDIANGSFKQASEESVKLIELLIEGLRYFQTYDWLLLRTIISFGYLGWISYSTLFIIKTYTLGDQKLLPSDFSDIYYYIVNFGFWITLIAFYALLYQKDSPLTYYCYGVFPIFFAQAAFKEWPLIPGILANLKFTSSNFNTIVHIAFYLISLEVLVVSYFYREILTLCLLVMGLLWPMTMPKAFAERHFLILRAWRATCLLTSVFTLLPVELEEDVLLMYLYLY